MAGQAVCQRDDRGGNQNCPPNSCVGGETRCAPVNLAGDEVYHELCEGIGEWLRRME